MKLFSRFKKKRKASKIVVVAFAVITFWWGVWGILDHYFFPQAEIFAYVGAIILAFIILYLDDFHLKELE
ncbi:MAG: hypothetical protein WDN67_03745 [Candidatus Moraniibacteriota bacterium]